MYSRRFHIIVLGLLLLMTACHHPVEEVQVHYVPCADMPSPRASACACTLGDKAYIFGGRDSAGNYLKDVWEYNSKTDSWRSLGNIVGLGRIKPTIIAYKNVLYLGLGYASKQPYQDDYFLEDWWCYNPQNNTWKQMADYPSYSSHDARPFVVNDTIYVIYGTDWCFSRKIFYYVPQIDKWKSVKDNYRRAESAFGTSAAQVGNRVFLGLGFREQNISQWWEADLSTDKWTERASLPDKGRTLSACAATTDYIYLFGGRHFASEDMGGEVFNTFLRYDIAKDKWQYGGQMPQRAENLIAFTIQGHAYFGLGEDENGKLINKLYRIE